MKILNNISLFKLITLILINLYLKSYLILLITILLLIFNNFKSLITFIILFSLCILVNSNRIDFIKYGVVDTIYDSYCYVDKLLYKVKVYNPTNLEIGDIIYYGSSNKITDNSTNIKNNILFETYNTPKILFNIKTRSLINKRFDSFDENTSAYLKKTLVNEYSNDIDIDFLGYGFSFYYLLIILFKKDKRICILTLIIYTLLFGFKIKFYLILIDYLLLFVKLNDYDKLAFKVLLIILINKQLLFNYSFLITFIYSLIFKTKRKDIKYILFIAQSLFFNSISFITSIFYKEYIYIKLVIFGLSIFTFIFNSFELIYLRILNILYEVLSLFTFNIRGKINIFTLIFFFVLIKLFNIKKDGYKCILLCLLLIFINNPISHVNFIDVGQGDACLIHGPFNLYNILIDTGSSYNYSKLKNTLYEEGIYNIDYLIISHLDEDHSGCIDKLNKDFNVKEIVYEGKDINIKNISLEYLYLGEFDNENDNSLVYLLNIDGYKFLFTGDISKSVENSIVYKHAINNIDVLKVSHHGSNTGTSRYFVGSILPKYAIISTSGKYDHPKKEVLETLESYFVEYFITKEKGNIKFYFTNIYDFIFTNSECIIMNS